MSAPARSHYLMWAIETPKGALLVDTATRFQTTAWSAFRGYLGIQSRQAAKAQGYRLVRVVIHRAKHAWSPFA